MIDALFEIINFVIVSGLFYYGARRFVIPSLMQSYSQETAQRNNLIEDITVAQLTQQELILVQEAEQLEKQRLQEKIEQWILKNNETKRRQVQEVAANNNKIKQRREKQQAFFEEFFLLKNSKLEALNEAQEQLKSMFEKSPDLRQVYIQHALRQLKKDAHV